MGSYITAVCTRQISIYPRVSVAIGAQALVQCPPEVPNFCGGCFFSIVTAMAQKVTVTKDELMIKVTAAGFDDAQIFEAIRFAGLEDFVKALHPCDEV